MNSPNSEQLLVPPKDHIKHKEFTKFITSQGVGSSIPVVAETTGNGSRSFLSTKARVSSWVNSCQPSWAMHKL